MKFRAIVPAITLTVFVAFVSCNGKHKKEKGKRIEAATVQAVSKKVAHKEFLGNPIEIGYLNDNIIVYDYQGEKIFKCINLKNNEVINFGDRGRGPHDIMMPIFSLDKENGVIKMYCRQLHKVLYFNMEDIQRKNTKPFFYKKLKGMDRLVMFDFDMKNNYSIARIFDRDSPSPYIFLDASFEKMGEGGDYPKLNSNKELPPMAFAMVFQGYIASNIDNDRFLFFYSNSDGFEVAELKDGQVHTVRRELNGDPHFTVKDEIGNVFYNSNNEFGYLAVDCTENFVYALYSGKSKDSQNGNAMKALHGNEIRVYTWDGLLKKRIKLDRQINTMCCKNDEVFYGSNTMDEPSIFEFVVKK